MAGPLTTKLWLVWGLTLSCPSAYQSPVCPIQLHIHAGFLKALQEKRPHVQGSSSMVYRAMFGIVGQRSSPSHKMVEPQGLARAGEIITLKSGSPCSG